MAAILTEDWRVGSISFSDSASGTGARQGFANGVRYFCGLCRPVATFRDAQGGFIKFPLSVEINSGASLEEKQSAVRSLADRYVQTVFVYGEAADEQTLTYLSEAKIEVIGTTDPPASLKNYWIATITVNLAPAIEKAWPELIEGKSAGVVSSDFGSTNVNEENFSAGRQALMQKFYDDMNQGMINTGVIYP